MAERKTEITPAQAPVISRRKAVRLLLGLGAIVIIDSLVPSSEALAQTEEFCDLYDPVSGKTIRVYTHCSHLGRNVERGYTPQVGIFVGSDGSRMWNEGFGENSSWTLEQQKIIADVTHENPSILQAKAANEFLAAKGYDVKYYPEGISTKVWNTYLYNGDDPIERYHQKQAEIVIYNDYIRQDLRQDLLQDSP